VDFRKQAGRLAVLIAALGASAALASPGHATPALAITPGAYCAHDQRGQVQYYNGRAYVCSQDAGNPSIWRWHPAAGQPAPTHTTGGGSSTGNSGGTSTNTGTGNSRQGDMLPVTGAGATVAALTGGGLAAAGGIAVFATRRRRRRFVA
jgi:LPXTG-motif cell wall-anchored protein